MVVAGYKGYQYGFLRTFAISVGRVIIWTLAVLLAHNLGTVMQNFFTSAVNAQWSTEVGGQFIGKATEFLFSGMGFAIITIIGTLLLRIIVRGLKFINHLPLLGFTNRLAGLLLNMIMMYVTVFFTLQIIGIWPISELHVQLTHSPVAQMIMQKTPVLSRTIYEWFLLI